MPKHDAIIKWALQQLTEMGKPCTESGHQKITETAYSAVYRFVAETGEVFYLKLVPSALFSEPKILHFLQQNGIKNIPSLIAQNESLHCFLMLACGQLSLREAFRKKEDIQPYLIRGISVYTTMQQLMENARAQLLALGVPDCRLDRFPDLYLNLIAQEGRLLADGLTLSEIERLRVLHPTIIELCRALSQYAIPETIGHCDFHDNNMLLDKARGEVSIIDWGETVITHPFFSLQGCLWHLVYFSYCTYDDAMYREIAEHCMQPWAETLGKAELIAAFTLSEKLNGVYAALGFERLYRATENETESVSETHRGAIAGCLRTFLQSY